MCLLETKNPLTKAKAFTKGENVRGATLIYYSRGYKLIPLATDVRLPSQNTRSPFDCALRGPFDKQYPTQLAATWALCAGFLAVISASTV